jgi:hypothetical protein
VLWLLNADANGGLGFRMQKVEAERLEAGVKQMRTMNQRFKHEHMHNCH